MHPNRKDAITHEQARKSLQRFVNLHFKNVGEKSRASIPAHQDDDDILLSDYISQQELGPGLGSGALREALEAVRRELKEKRIDGVPMWDWISNGTDGLVENALSLSSPIEPDMTFFHFKEYDGCEHDSDNYVCGICAKRHVGELLARPTPQASSEIREALAAAQRELEFHKNWPDGSPHREKWLLHVWYFIPAHIIAEACIRAKEDTGPHYLPFMEPAGWEPKGNFTCWICGQATPHPHTPEEIKAASKTLEVFREHVWSNLCKEAALSLSNPIEPAITELGAITGEMDHDTPHDSTCVKCRLQALAGRSTSQASSEVREAQYDVLALMQAVRRRVEKYQWDSGDANQEATSIANDIIGVVKRALTPSRQGAAKRVEG